MEQQVYSITEVAQLTGKHYNTIYSWIRKGILPAKKVNGEYLVWRPAFERLVGIQTERG